jgi:hypothetical protein
MQALHLNKFHMNVIIVSKSVLPSSLYQWYVHLLTSKLTIFSPPQIKDTRSLKQRKINVILTKVSVSK